QRPQLIGHPAGERIFLPPSDARDRSKMKDCILSFNGLLDCAVIPDVTPNLFATQRPSVGAAIQGIDCDSITHDFELFRYVTPNESTSSCSEDTTDDTAPAPTCYLHSRTTET